MRVLVTGGAGFIGHNVAIYLALRGYKVSVYDTLERSRADAVRKLMERGIPIYRKDVRGEHSLSGYDVVIHCAAYVDVAESFAKPREYFENNVIGTASIAKAASDAGALFIYISSASVYGDPVKIPIPEDHPLRPISPYGASKAMGEQIVELYSSIYGLKHVILRLFNVYGPGQNPSYAGVISRFIESVKRGEPPRIYGDGSQTRDFIHIEDVARAIELVIEKKPAGYIFNIATGKQTSILELARLIIRIANAKSEPVFDKPRPGDIKHSCADISRARSIIGFEPRISLEEGIKGLLSI
jgi:UDP-glucose 4-epimerase